MNAKKRLYINLGALIIVLILGALLFSTYKPPTAPLSQSSGTPANAIPINPDANLAQMPAEAVTVHQTDTACQSLHSNYENIDGVKKVEKVDTRFVNVHKKVDSIVYRLRFFYKDSSENEIPTYLLYKENQNDEDILIEKSPYKKGKMYLKIEQALGEVLYTEEGLNIGPEKDLYLHYENKKLKDLQGITPNQNAKNFIECRF